MVNVFSSYMHQLKYMPKQLIFLLESCVRPLIKNITDFVNDRKL